MRLLLILLLLPGCTAASKYVPVADPGCPGPANAAVSVTVTSDGEVISGAEIRYTAENWDSTIIQLTDASGETVVQCVMPGDGYDLQVSKAGYQPRHLRVNARSGAVAIVNVELKRSPGA